MSEFSEGPTKTFKTSAAIPQFARVKYEAAGTVAVAGVADKDIGVATREAFASGEAIAVRLRSAAGTMKCIAAGPVTNGAEVNTAASGKVDDAAASGSFNMGIALDAATADGDIIEVLRNTHGDSANP